MTYQKRAFNDDSPEAARYRELYEGAQRSLRDMTIRQTEAIERHNALKKAVAKVCQQFNPAMFEKFEADMGHTASEADNKTLLVLLTAVLESLEDKQGRMHLSTALANAGAPGVTPDTHSAMAIMLLGASLVSETVKDSPGLEDIFEVEEVPLVEIAEHTPAPVTEESATEGVSIDELFATEATPDTPETPSVLAELFEDESPLPDEPALDDLFADDVPVLNDEAVEVDDFFSGEDFEPLPKSDDSEEPAVEDALAVEDVPTVEETKTSETKTATSLYGQQAPVVDTTPAPKAKKKVVKSSSTVPNPQLLDVPVAAEEAVEEAVELDLEACENAISLLAAPMPVFQADLEDLFGSPKAAQTWISEQNSEDRSAVSLIVAPSRSDVLGSLIFPKKTFDTANEEWLAQPWPAAMKTYFARDLHRVGALLRLTGDSLTDTPTFSEETVTFHQNRPHGIRRVVTALTKNVEKTVEAIKAELEGDFVQLAVLAYPENYSSKSLVELSDAIVEAAGENNWDIKFPVIIMEAAKFGSGSGTSDLLLAP